MDKKSLILATRDVLHQLSDRVEKYAAVEGPQYMDLTSVVSSALKQAKHYFKTVAKVLDHAYRGGEIDSVPLEMAARIMQGTVAADFLLENFPEEQVKGVYINALSASAEGLESSLNYTLSKYGFNTNLIDKLKEDEDAVLACHVMKAIDNYSEARRIWTPGLYKGAAVKIAAKPEEPKGILIEPEIPYNPDGVSPEEDTAEIPNILNLNQDKIDQLLDRAAERANSIPMDENNEKGE